MVLLDFGFRRAKDRAMSAVLVQLVLSAVMVVKMAGGGG